MAFRQVSGAPYSVSDSYRYNGEVSPDIAVEEQALNRKQQIANLLLQQGLQGAGSGQMVGRFYVPTAGTQHLAKLAEVLAGGLGTHAIDMKRQDLSTLMNEERGRAIQRYTDGAQGKQVPERTLPQGTPETPSNLEEIIADTKPAMGTPQVRPMTTPSLAPSYGEDAASPGKYYDDLPPSPELLAAIQQRMQPPPMPYQPGDPGVPATQGPVNEAQFQKPDPMAARQAVMEALSHQDPRVREAVRFMEQQKAADEEKATQRTFMGEQKDEDRANRLENTRLGFSRDLMMAKMMGMNKEDLAKLEAGFTKQLEQMKQEGQDRRDNVQPLVGVDPKSPTGYAYFDARTKQKLMDAPKPAAEVKAEHDGSKPKGKSATTEKEIIETDKMIQSEDAAMKSLDKALEVNESAMGFTGAGMAAAAGSILPEAIRPKAVDATVELDNIVMSSALPQLKEIFGGNPTEGERKVLLDMQGASSKPPAQRKEIFDRARAAVEARKKFNVEKAKKLRDDTYYSPQGSGASAPTAPNAKEPSIDDLLEKYQ